MNRCTTFGKVERGRSAAAWPQATLHFLLALVLTLACREAGAVPAADWQMTLPLYVQDPIGQRRTMMTLGRGDTSQLPPMAQLAVADAYLRSNRLSSASRLFDSILDQDPGEPWLGLAALGRGWVAARRGRMEEAREYFDAAAGLPGDVGWTGDFMVGMIDAGDGLTDTALDRFARIAESPEASEDLRLAATMGEGYARFWVGDDAGARDAFAEVAATAAERDVAQDARFGEALANWREGNVVAAEGQLESLAGAAAKGAGTGGTIGLARLDPRAMLRASARRYGKLPLRMPVDLILPMLHADAPALARVALRRLRRGEEPPATINRLQQRESTARTMPSGDRRFPDREHRDTAAHPAASRPAWRAVLLLSGLVLAAVLLLMAYPRHPVRSVR